MGLARLATQSSRAQTPGAFDIVVDGVLVIFLRVPYLPRARFVDCFIDKLRFMGTFMGLLLQMRSNSVCNIGQCNRLGDRLSVQTGGEQGLPIKIVQHVQS